MQPYRLMTIMLVVNAEMVNPASRMADDRLPDPAQNSTNTALRGEMLFVLCQALPTWEHS